MSKTLALTEELIALSSVTPDDKGCQQRLIALLSPLGFRCETIQSGNVTNLWARKGEARPLVVFAGHTDVVPTGPLDQWHSDPFVPTQRCGKLYGRGAADMKTSIAAMVVAIEEFIAAHPGHKGSIAFLLTSDEEGPATDGTVVVCDKLKARGEQLDYCIVGEPTSTDQLGDVIKNGRRGSMSGKMSNIHGGTGATNVIPGEVTIDFNFRFSTASTIEGLQQRVHAILNKYDFEYELKWTISGRPFLTPRGTLSDALCAAIKAETGLDADLSTTGGTSDGRFIAQICPQVVEFGPPNESIHKIDEHIEIRYIDPLKNIYRRTLENLLS